MNDIVEDTEDKEEIDDINEVKTDEIEIDKLSVEELVCELEESKKLQLEYLDHLQRLQAEFDNYKKIVDRQKKELIDYAHAGLITELIDVMENLERGIDSARDSKDPESIIKGMEMVYSSLEDILGSGGLEPIEAIGKKFDPHYHEAMMKSPSDEVPNNTVIEEFQRGYMIKKKVLRYAKVKVSTNSDNNINNNKR
ncbi:MAG: nucleotide exchange factor GrpE [Methanosarcinales archaeon]|nr:nucleotide exchange factor GrpE [Methanosarcinales archaeon]